MRRRPFLVSLVLVVAACGGGAPTATDGPDPSSSTSVPASTSTADTDTGPVTTAGPGGTTTTAATVPATTTNAADEGELWIGTLADTSIPVEPGVTYSGKLDDVRTGEHPGYTRVVFDFTDDGAGPAYTVGYRAGPFLAPSGEAVPVAGAAFLYLHMFPARTVDFDSPDLEPTYEGPLRFAPGSRNLTEVVFISDFEATMEWVLGVDRAAPYRVFTLTGPPRVVIDVAHGPGVLFLDEANFAVGTEPYTAAVLREVDTPQDALDALFAGPTADERQAGLRFVASEATGAELLSVEEGVAVVRLQGGCSSGGSTFSVAGLIGPTLKQFPGISVVKIEDPDGRTGDPDGPGDSIPECLEP